MELGDTLKPLSIGLSRLLRYSFGGFLLITLGGLVNPGDTEVILKAVPWELTAISAVVVGAGIYAAHRSLVIPIHHLGLCFILWGLERLKGRDRSESTSPTRWLAGIGVPLGERMLAYTALRHSDFFHEREREKLNVEHAENGLVVMIAEALFAATAYGLAYPEKSRIGWAAPCVLAVAFALSAYPRAIGQHTLECLRFRAHQDDVRTKLQFLGFLPVAQAAASAHTR